ncbi:hypothetical protein [Sporosalibacterium faouarense]|uniref:hypothetical protein n=1 Tax=Sporosalibacterium faouarense TaxID=516123 RepID=UPI00141D197E|nr:hypothetical protein [Sporosalibacterium faouarense]MTI47221.1 hypothetical protein [Bacillota bacterium]
MNFLNGFDKGFKSRKRKLIEEEKVLNQLKDATEFEKGDFFALIIAGLITIIPVVLVVLFLYYGISMYFFG